MYEILGASSSDRIALVAIDEFDGEKLAERFAKTLPRFFGVDEGGGPVTGYVRPVTVIHLDEEDIAGAEERERSIREIEQKRAELEKALDHLRKGRPKNSWYERN